MKKLLLIINPQAGRTQVKQKLMEIVDLFAKADYMITVYPTQKKGDAKNIVVMCGNDYDMIVCAGGDGTLDETVTGIYRINGSMPLGYIPCGTTNDFAKSMKLSVNPISAVNNILEGTPFACDIGTFNSEQIFVYVAAFGAFTEVSYKTPQVNKNMMGNFAYFLEGVKTITNLKSYQVFLEHDGGTIERNCIFLMVTNSLSVGGFKSLACKNVEFDDGLFEVLLVRTPENALEMQGIIRSFLTGEINEEYICLFKTAKLYIESAELIPWTLDGEYGGEFDKVTIQNIKKKVMIMRKNV